jgi:hypothetical protein
MAHDLTGMIFGRLTALRVVGKKHGRYLWECQCTCGGTLETISSSLLRGSTTTCGCRLKEGVHTTHGLRKSSEYGSWASMKQRCTNPMNKSYKDYGGRGIKICDRWLHSFENFYADMGPRPPGLMLEREKNDEGYNPDNCSWATRDAQNGNRRPMPLRRFRI